MKKSLLSKRPRPRKKLLNRQVVKNDPEEYGKRHIKAIQNPEGWYRP